MVAVRLARGWVGYGGSVHRAGDLVDVDAITLAKLEACGVVTPWEASGPASPGLRSAGSVATGATREGGVERARGPARAERAPSSTVPCCRADLVDDLDRDDER